MMFFALFSGVNGWEYCKAPADHPDPVPNMKLRYVQVIIRHGMRTPLYHLLDSDYVGKWECENSSSLTPRIQSGPQERYRFFHTTIRQNTLEYPPSCQSGELTIEGQEMHLDLGSSFREYYVNQLKFLPPAYDPSKIGFESSPVDRCLRSGSSFMLGLYPPLNPNEVISIETGLKAIHPLVYNADHCEAIKERKELFLQSEIVHNMLEKCKENKDLQYVLNLTQQENNYNGVNTVSEWSLAFNCSNNSPPQWMNDEFMDLMREIGSIDQMGQNEFIGANLSASYLVNYMMELTDFDLSQHNGKIFHLLSSHDSSLASLLVFLGHKFDEPTVPRYRSHIAMEIWQNSADFELYIRFVYNGKPVKIAAFNGETLVNFHAFRLWQENATGGLCPIVGYV